MALASIFWAIVGFELYYVDPELVENIPLMRWFLPFLIPLWLAIFFTGLTTKNTWQRSSIYTSAITFYIWLRLVDINNVFSLLILILLVFVIETAWLGEQTPKKSNKNPPLPKRG